MRNTESENDMEHSMQTAMIAHGLAMLGRERFGRQVDPERVTVIALYGLGVKEAFAINVVRVLLSGFTFGNMSSILFGMAGAVLSLFLMAVCKKLRLFDMTGISIIGGVAHNIGQFLVAAFVTKTFGVFSYLPVLLIAGTVAGALIGLLGGIILKRISRILPKG